MKKGSQGILKIPTGSFSTLTEFVPSKDVPQGGIKWDEDIIAEHDKLRGTRMRIDEPNTPYYNPGDSYVLEEVPSFDLQDGRVVHSTADDDGVTDRDADIVIPSTLRERLEELVVVRL